MRSSVVDSVATFLKVAVAYVGPEIQVLRPMEVVPGTTVQGAIEGSGVLDQCPEIDLQRYKVGIYGKLAALEQPLEDGDRVEIYRPLIADPKETRKRRAQEGKPMRKGGA
jgi:putative ubiquitin-RnfH superfamily antitoxin RatB of RatAB toxin-antitoxin module